MSELSIPDVRVVMAITEVRPRTIDQALKRLERVLGTRPEASHPAGIRRTDAGALNQIISLWTGRDEAAKIETSSEVLSVLDEIRVGQRTLRHSPALFSPMLLPRRLGDLRVSVLHVQAKVVFGHR